MAKYKPTSKDELLGDIESEIDAFTKEVEEQDRKRDTKENKLPFKVPILTKSSDKQGHKAQLRFSVPQWMVGYATSLMSEFPQAKTPTDMQRACFYAGIKLLSYIVRDRGNSNIAFYNTFAKQVEWEMVDMERISHVEEFIIFLRKKRKEGIISTEQYIGRRNELFDTLTNIMTTPIGKGAQKEFIKAVKDKDEVYDISMEHEYDWR